MCSTRSRRARDPRPLGARVPRDRRRSAGARRPSARHASRVSPAPLGLLVTDEGVEDVELVGGSGKPPLLELARHRNQPLRCRGEILARERPSPCVRPCAAVSEDPAGEDEPRLVLRAQLREGLQVGVVEEGVRDVELGLDVGLLRCRPDGTPHHP